MLQDLNALALRSKETYQDTFAPTDIILTESFRQNFASILRRTQRDIIYFEATSLVTTREALQIFVPNQWYVMSAFMIEFLRELHTYKEYLLAVLRKRNYGNQERDDFIKKARGSTDKFTTDLFYKDAEELFSSLASSDPARDASYLTRFIFDYSWWFGGKFIFRTDFFESPLLALLGVVNLSQGFIVEICGLYLLDTSLANAAMNLIKQKEKMPQPADETVKAGAIGGRNLLVYGAPGTGKSRYLEDQFGGPYTTRVVFHPEYTYYDFIGAYKPVPLYSEEPTLYTVSGEKYRDGKPFIDYQFVPGPFIRVLVDAYLNKDTMHTLLIEEINRANAAAVFGEVFQLLDRYPDGSGEYSFKPPPDLHNYLASIEEIAIDIKGGIILPPNMNIVATMNSADQGVNTLDAAFKRRWEYKYIPISFTDVVHEKAIFQYAGLNVSWGDFVNALNEKLKDLRVEEDRLVGPFFIRPSEVGRSAAMDKLLLYLWDDVLRHRRQQFFDNSIRTFAELVDNFHKNDVLQIKTYLELLLIESESNGIASQHKYIVESNPDSVSDRVAERGTTDD